MGAVAETRGIEVEALRKEDSSWHPCQVSLSSDISAGFGLIVDFGSHDSRDIIRTKEEALARLRIRSTALQGDDCLDIKEGQRVLAYQGTQLRRLLFDSQVERVCRVRHSKRVQCRCTFVIKWLQSDLKGGMMTVPSSSIMKLAIGNIDSHPTVSTFLDSLKTMNHSGVSPSPSLLEDYETDLSRVVEKQIEEIGKLAEASWNGCSEEVLLVLKKDTVDFKGQARQVSFLCEKASQIQNNSRRTTRSQSKIQLKTMDTSQPPTEAEPNRHHLSPLGARAALASLMFKLPQEEEFSICHLDKEGFANKSLSIPKRHVNVVSLDVAEKLFLSGARFQEKVSEVDNLFPRLEACADQFVSKHNNNTKLTDAQHKSSQIKGSSGKQNNSQKLALIPDGLYCDGSNISNAKASLACPVSDRKMNSPMSTTLTHSAFQKGIKGLNDELELKFSAEEMDPSLPIHAKRLTRSMIQKEVKILTPEINQGLEESEPAHDAWSDFAKGDLGTAETRERRRKRAVSSPLNTEANFTVAQENNKKLRVPDEIRITTTTEGENHSGEGESIQCKNSNSSHQVKNTISKKKPELRFSPRLKFLPRTRSQKR